MTAEREPLWAGALAHEPRPDPAAYFPEAERPARAEAPARPAAAAPVAAVCALLVSLTLLAAAVLRHGDYERRVVPSSWGAIRMRCDTARLGPGGGAVEWFRCRGAGLPPGLYTSPATGWTSDLTRQHAFASAIVIDSRGELRGFALY